MTNISEHSVDEQELEAAIALALARAKELGADEAEVAATRERGLTVTARMRDVETVEYLNDRGFGVTVYFGHARGSASTNDYSPDAVKRAVDKASSIARQTTADPCAGLADRDMLAFDYPEILLDYPWPLSNEEARDVALQTEAAALDSDGRIVNSEGATVASARSLRIYGNSHGFTGTSRRSRHSLSCAVVAADDNGMERDFHYSTARDPALVERPQHVGERSARRALDRLGSKRLATRSAPVIFAADLARGLFGHAAQAMSGGAQYRRASFLLEAAGEQVFPEFVQWHERPLIDGGLASAAFDNEGVRTRERQLVRDGAFTGYILSSYSARRLGLASTGNAGGLHNVDIVSDRGAESDLLAVMGTGLYVTELMGQGVNGVTGDYSRGAAGFWVEDGRLQHPVSGITISGNLREMYSKIAALGDDIDCRGAIRTGSVLLESMTIAGD